MEIPQNAVVSGTLDGLIQQSDGTPVSASFHRCDVAPDMVQLFPVKALLDLEPDWTPPPGMFRPDRAPAARPRSNLPPPGNLHLSLKLGRFIGHGRSGIVFAAEQMPTAGTVNDENGASFPPLVVKVARRERCLSLAREAWFYDHLECLQGVVLPRCYGWFEMKLPSEWDVAAWRNYPTSNRGTDAEEGPSEFMEYTTEELRQHNIARATPFATELAEARDRVFILVLERLGDTMENSFDMREDMYAAYKEIALLSVDMSRDVKYNNILMAPESPPGLPSLPSPFTGLTHKLRVIDFELAMKTFFSVETLMKRCNGYLYF